MKNDVWDIVPKPENNSVVSSKWIYKIKHATDGSIEKYKEIFVARVHFHQNHHGTFFHDEVGSTPDGYKDSLPEWYD